HVHPDGIKQTVLRLLQLYVLATEPSADRRLRHSMNDVASELNAADVVVYRDDVSTICVVNQVAGKARANRRRGSLCIGARSKLDMRALDDRIVLDDGVLDLVIAIDRRIRHAIHDD